MLFRCHLLVFLVCVLTVSAEARTWTNTKNQRIEADFLKLESGVAYLKKGKTIYKVPIQTLSEKDQDFIEKQLEEEKEPVPVEPSVDLPIKLIEKVSGNDLSEKSIVGKPIVLHQWQAHCGACPLALAGFEKLARRKKKSGATFMIWHSFDSVDLAKNKSKSLALKLPVYHGGMIQWDKKFGKFVWPHVVLIDAKGKIAYMGATDRKFRQALKESLK